jgi:hypothetical protein
MSDTVTPKKRRHGQRLTTEQKRTAQETFLLNFAVSANLTAACRAAGVERITVYRWQEHDETFSLRYKQAEAEVNDVVRAAIFRRAVEGVNEPLHHNGRIVKDEQGKPVTVKKYSDTLLIFLAKARMPEFRDKQQVEVSGKDGGPIEVNDAHTRLAEKLQRLADIASARPHTAADN